jgi:hypothetical protein
LRQQSSCFAVLHSTGEIGRPVGKNCDLAEPPNTAGEEFDHGALLRIYPRARDIGMSYNGCQAVWVQTQDGVNLGWLVWIETGEVARMWSADRELQAKIGGCLYEHGQITRGDPTACPLSTELIMKSLAPGCVAKKIDAVAAGGLGARVPGCEDDD